MFSYASAMAALRSLQRRYAFIACRPIGTTEYGRELTHVRIGCGRRRVLLTAAQMCIRDRRSSAGRWACRPNQAARP